MSSEFEFDGGEFDGELDSELAGFLPSSADYMPPEPEAYCLDLARQVDGLSLEALRDQHVAHVIRNSVQSAIDEYVSAGLISLDATCLPEGRWPTLMLYSGDVRVRLNGGLRQYELHSGPPSLAERRLTNTEMASLIAWVDYLLHAAADGLPSDLEHTLRCVHTWVQQLGAGDSFA